MIAIAFPYRFAVIFAITSIVVGIHSPLLLRDAYAQRSSDEGLPGSTRDCTLVELYPGYPAYRGNITGVMGHWGGIGDYECVEALEDLDPDFNRRREDRANKRAATSLGIKGEFEDWTWENWMMIEEHRGFPASCYTCLMLDGSTEPSNPNTRPSIDDPRVQLGFVGERLTIDRIRQEEFGEIYSSTSFYEEDYLLRAAAYLRLGPSANAQELLSEMSALIYEAGQPGGSFYSYADVADAILKSGGYTATTSNMAPSDQQFVALAAFFVGMLAMTPPTAAHLTANFEAALDGWRLTGYRESLRDYLRDNWTP